MSLKTCVSPFQALFLLVGCGENVQLTSHSPAAGGGELELAGSMGEKVWNFHTGLGGWTGGLNGKLVGLVSEGHEDEHFSSLSATIVGSDDQLRSPLFDIDAENYDTVSVILKNGTLMNSARLFWSSQGETFSENAALSVPIETRNGSAGEGYVGYAFAVGGHPAWKGKVKRLRLDLQGNGSAGKGDFRIQQIRVFKKPQGQPRSQVFLGACVLDWDGFKLGASFQDAQEKKAAFAAEPWSRKDKIRGFFLNLAGSDRSLVSAMIKRSQGRDAIIELPITHKYKMGASDSPSAFEILTKQVPYVKGTVRIGEPHAVEQPLSLNSVSFVQDEGLDLNYVAADVVSDYSPYDGAVNPETGKPSRVNLSWKEMWFPGDLGQVRSLLASSGIGGNGFSVMANVRADYFMIPEVHPDMRVVLQEGGGKGFGGTFESAPSRFLRWGNLYVAWANYVAYSRARGLKTIWLAPTGKDTETPAQHFESLKLVYRWMVKAGLEPDVISLNNYGHQRKDREGYDPNWLYMFPEKNGSGQYAMTIMGIAGWLTEEVER